MKKFWVIGAILIIIVLVVIINPFKKSEDRNQNSTRTSTTVVERGNIIITVNSTGIIEPITTVELKSKASGEIIELPIEEGDTVKAGQLIARLDATTAQNDYNQAQADVEVARAALSIAQKQWTRQEQLYEEKHISELEHEQSSLALQQAKANLVQAETALEYAKEKLNETVIKSPIRGIVLKKDVEKGQIIASGISNVSGGTTIATIADMLRVYVTTAVDEVDIGQIKPGQKATIIAESFPDIEFEGIVLRIHPLAQMEQNVTTFDVTIEVDNREGLLMAGMNTSVEITAGFKQNVLNVPREALTDAKTLAGMINIRPDNDIQSRRRDEGGNMPSQRQAKSEAEQSKKPNKLVITVNNGQETICPVEIGLASFDKVEIVSGLNEGDTILATVTSKALQQRDEFLERTRSWNQLPGMGGRR
jgi:HlyD family secretion protein